jgi:wyosine [tRNA(Phe)-imidazoG37] synthetase (radical SAM superfamily)
MAGSATLFDHLKQITDIQNPKYWDTLEDADKRTWSNFMIFRFLSMKYEWVELIAELQPYLQEIPPKTLYLTLIDLIPKSRTFLKYMKPTKSEDYESWIIDLVGMKYEVSKLEAEEYVKILYSIKGGHQILKEIAEGYAVDTKLIKKLKLQGV